MTKDRVSMDILSVLKESANRETLTEMPQKVKIRNKVDAYDFNELSPSVKQSLSGKDNINSSKDAEERFKQDANLDLQNRLNKIVPDAFRDNSLANFKGSDDSLYTYTYTDVEYGPFAKYICSKFPELEYDENSYGDHDSFCVSIVNGTKEDSLRKVLSRKTNFDDLRRQQKVAINDYLIELCNELTKAFKENKDEFESKRDEYNKYINLSDKEKEDELSKYWYTKGGNVIKAKDLDESFISELNLKEATQLDIDDYIEIYDFDELDEFFKNRITERKTKIQIQKMFDRMTEILEKEFTDYMSARGLELEPGQFDIEDLLYNMTHDRSNKWGKSSLTKFNITKGELISYIKNNTDLVEKYGQEEIDRLLNYIQTDMGDSQPVYTIRYYGGKDLGFDQNIHFDKYDYSTGNYEYFDGADEKLKTLYNELQHDLALDFYSSYKLLDKSMKQLEDEAKKIVYERMAKSKDKYLRNGEKFDKNKYNVVEDNSEEA